jgi:putative ATP-dependent endonuclease of OLD family
MRIARIRIENFRNFKTLDVPLAEHAVIVGENKVGKSNLVYALRLVLDPSLPDSARQLRQEDFWDGVPRPIPADARIRIAVDLADFEDSDDQLASVGDYLVQAQPMLARLTYEFRVATTLPRQGQAFEFVMYGGDREDARITWELRRRLALEVVPALRDAETDLANWRRSPLRPILSKAVDLVAAAKKTEIAKSVEKAASAMIELKEVGDVSRLITTTLDTLVGPAQTTTVQLGLAPTDAERMFRALRLLLDNGIRGISEASLGVANTLYLTLKILEVKQLAAEGLRDHTFLGVEEPEAHLHPQVQRQIFRNLLRPRKHLPQSGDTIAKSATTILLTTHSPHIASVAPVRSLILLRASKTGSIGVSAAQIQLDPAEAEDLERYLDVTRAEMLFARCVLLVEGDSEAYVLPKLASLIGHDLDSLGITVCSVAGTNFAPHVKLLRALGIPFAVLTDYDVDDDGESLGENRVLGLMSLLIDPKTYAQTDRQSLLAQATSAGIFLGSTTFEIDLVRSGRAEPMARSLLQLAPGPTAKSRAEAWLAKGSVPAQEETRFLKDVVAIGKGRFAQRLATLLQKQAGSGPYAQGPKYVIEALSYLVAQCPQ